MDVRAVDDHLRVDVRRVDPLAGEILGEETRRLGNFGHDGGDDHFLRPVRRRVETRTLGEQRLGEPTRLILARQHATELVVPPFRPDAFVGDARENVALLVDPTAQTLVQRVRVDGRDQLATVAVAHGETLVDSFERRAGIGTRHQTGDRVVTDADPALPELVGEMIRPVDRRSTLFRRVRLR